MNNRDHSDAQSGNVRPQVGGDPHETTNATAAPRARKGPEHKAPGFDLWCALDILANRWHWLVVGALIAGTAFFFLGQQVVKPKFTATAQLLRFETPGEREFFTEALSADTFAALIKAPELLTDIGNLANPPLPPEKMLKTVLVEPEPDSDLIKIVLAWRDPHQAVRLVNAYASNAVVYSRQWYSERAKVVATEYLQRAVKQMDGDIQSLDQQFRDLHLPPELSSKLAQVGGALSSISNNISLGSRSGPLLVARQRERLETAMNELNDLLAKYTSIHPLVLAKQDQIKEMETTLEGQIAAVATNPAAASAQLRSAALTPTGRPGDPQFNPESDILRMKLMALEQGRVTLMERHRQAEAYAERPPGVVKVYSTATLQSLQSNHRRIKIGMVTIFGGVMGALGALMLVGLVEFVDGRLKTRDDLRRVTKLPVLGALGDLHDMTSEQRNAWAFRTWTMLQGRLSPSPTHGLVCGITSASPGEGRTTWVKLLADAASMAGFQVLTIATKPTNGHAQITNGKAHPSQASPASSPPSVMSRGATETRQNLPAPAQPSGSNAVAVAGNGNGNTLGVTALSSPGEVTQKLVGPNPQPMVHIPLPGWVWNLERRKQWGEALAQWRQIDNLVILVELPPASVPESVLLGSNLPNVVWLAKSGAANAATTRTLLETMRNARCNIVGAVLNGERSAPMKSRFPRWFGCMVGITVLAAGLSNAAAQDPSAVTPTPTLEQLRPTDPNVRTGSFSATSRKARAPWQERLTLGPGDVLNVTLYGSPELSRSELVIGPDGRLSFLEAQDIVVTGLTVDELRARLDQSLGQFRRAARTMITPVAFRSKKYYVLGKVMTKGVYTLDRPITVLEAIARARGIENGLIDRNVVDLADFQRSFLARGGKRIPLNFEKLFYEGDLSQNIPIEPGDYLYFASGDLREVYIVGEVRLPGPVTYRDDLTIVAAITARAGFTERAYKSRVLVVRGPLENPERIAVDVDDIIDAKRRNFTLKPKDIIYVNSRPFIRVEELADTAATAFIQSLITGWTGVDVVRPIP